MSLRVSFKLMFDGEVKGLTFREVTPLVNLRIERRANTAESRS